MPLPLLTDHSAFLNPSPPRKRMPAASTPCSTAGPAKRANNQKERGVGVSPAFSSSLPFPTPVPTDPIDTHPDPGHPHNHESPTTISQNHRDQQRAFQCAAEEIAGGASQGTGDPASFGIEIPNVLGKLQPLRPG